MSVVVICTLYLLTGSTCPAAPTAEDVILIRRLATCLLMPSPFTAKFTFNFLSPVFCLASLHPISRAHSYTDTFPSHRLYLPIFNSLLSSHWWRRIRRPSLWATQATDSCDKHSLIVTPAPTILSSGFSLKLCFWGLFQSMPKMALSCCFVCRWQQKWQPSWETRVLCCWCSFGVSGNGCRSCHLASCT